MALIHRLTRLFKADAHAVLDRIEAPEALLKQAIRDMEVDLAQAEQYIQQQIQHERTLVRQADQLEAAVREHDAELDLCLQSDNSALARNVVRKKLEAQQLLQQIHAKLADIQEDLDTQRTGVERKQTALHSIRQKAALFDSGMRVTSNGEHDVASISDEQVEIALLREQDQRSTA